MPIKNFFDLLQKNISCSVIIVKAGSSRRFGSDKLSAMLADTPVLAILTTF